jgi:hypothetical protein
MAVRCRALHLARSEQGGTARLVLHDHRDAKGFCEFLADRARLHVCLSAARKWDHDADRLSGYRKGLGLRSPGEDETGGGDDERSVKPCHGRPLSKQKISASMQ